MRSFPSVPAVLNPKRHILEVAQIGDDSDPFRKLDLIRESARHMSSVFSEAYAAVSDIHSTRRQTLSAQQIYGLCDFYFRSH